MREVSESEFAARIALVLSSVAGVKAVTGPGRSGAIAAVYASHILGVPFVPYGQPAKGKILVIDTMTETGGTLQKAMRRYAGNDPLVMACYAEFPRVIFWYEATK